MGAVVLAVTTLAAIVFGAVNFQQRSTVIVPDDGVSWLDASQGVVAWHVTPGSRPTARESSPTDRLVSLNGAEVRRAVQVTQRLWRAGVWSEVTYKVERGGRTFEAKLVTIPAEKPFSLENYLRVVGLLYLFIGLFIFARRWTAARAVHFYIFCLASFVLFSFHYTGKLNVFDWEIYWARWWRAAGAGAAGPLCAGVSGAEHARRVAGAWTCLRVRPSARCCCSHIDVATSCWDSCPRLPARIALDQIELAYLGALLPAGRGDFPEQLRRAPNGVLRQQLKWVTGGTLAGIVPFWLVYILPYFAGRGAAAVDESVGGVAGAAAALLCLRHHPLPADGRGHHLQARAGLHGGDRGRGGGVRRDGGADRRAVPHRMAERARRAK